MPEEGYTGHWPAVIVADAATRARVDALWPSLGLDGAAAQAIAAGGGMR
jgi:hypothetical protein